MNQHFAMSRSAILSTLAACMALAGCGGGGGSGSDSSTPPPAHGLGLMKITISGIGGQLQSHAELLSGSGPQARVAQPTTVPAGLDIRQVSASTVDVGTRGSGGQRYFTVVYQVRNAQACNTPGTCTAYATARHNLTLVAANTAGNIGNTAIGGISLFDGSSNGDTQALVSSLLPTHGMQFNSGAGSGVLVRPGLESLQVFTEDEVAAIARDPGATDLFPYGYVVRNVTSASSRALPANPAANQWDGEVSFSFKLPLQADPKQDPYSITMIVQVVDDANTRVTESVEEQNYVGDIAANLRAATLGSTDLAVLGGRVAQTNVGDPICAVRTAGAAGAPTATLANNAGVSLAAAPYGISGVSPTAPVNAGFCAPMNAASFGNFIVSGSVSGLRTSGGPYSGSYGASTPGNVLSFTPTQPFQPGETVSYTLTTGLTGTGGGALAQVFNGSYVVGGVVPSSGTFVQSTPVYSGTTNTLPYMIATGDFNGDGKPDFAIALYGSGAVEVEINNGDGTFTAKPLVTGFDKPGGIAVADFNGDGHLDLVVTSFGFSTAPIASVLLNDGAGNFTVAGTAPLGSGPQNPVVGDFNGDGIPDVAVVNSFDTTVSILLGDGSGHLAAQPAVGVGSGPEVLAVADFNGDGKLDLAVSVQSDKAVRVLLNDGHAHFTASPEIPIGGFSYGLAAGDLNGDGIPDLAVANLSHSPGSVLLLFGDGSGGFSTGPTLGVGDAATVLLIGDFNGDGKADLAASNQGDPSNTPGSISVLLGDGKGGFAAARNTTAGQALYSLAAADFNGDGRLDFVGANVNDDHVNLYVSQP